MPEQARNLRDPEPAGRRPLDEAEERPQFLLGGDQGLEARPKIQGLAGHGQSRFPPHRVRRAAHSVTTAPELSRLRA